MIAHDDRRAGGEERVEERLVRTRRAVVALDAGVDHHHYGVGDLASLAHDRRGELRIAPVGLAGGRGTGKCGVERKVAVESQESDADSAHVDDLGGVGVVTVATRTDDGEPGSLRAGDGVQHARSAVVGRVIVAEADDIDTAGGKRSQQARRRVEDELVLEGLANRRHCRFEVDHHDIRVGERTAHTVERILAALEELTNRGLAVHVAAERDADRCFRDGGRSDDRHPRRGRHRCDETLRLSDGDRRNGFDLARAQRGARTATAAGREQRTRDRGEASHGREAYGEVSRRC